MPIRRLGGWLILFALSIGCAASHGAVHVAPDESRPHISWEIRTGGDDGDANFVCGSAQAGKPCSLQPSADKTRLLATVHLFVHAAAKPASYLGFMRASFFEGEVDRKLGEVNATVEPGSRPVGTTVIGRVTSKPGEYALTISVDATQPGVANPVRILQQVGVVVR
jgi:hypothetical protein